MKYCFCPESREGTANRLFLLYRLSMRRATATLWVCALACQVCAGDRIPAPPPNPSPPPPPGNGTDAGDDWGVSNPRCSNSTIAGNVSFQCELDVDLGSYYEGAVGVLMSVLACETIPTLEIYGYEVERNSTDVDRIRLATLECQADDDKLEIPFTNTKFTQIGIPGIGRIGFFIFMYLSCEDDAFIDYGVSLDICAMNDLTDSSVCGEDLPFSLPLPQVLYERVLNKDVLCPPSNSVSARLIRDVRFLRTRFICVACPTANCLLTMLMALRACPCAVDACWWRWAWRWSSCAYPWRRRVVLLLPEEAACFRA